MSKSNTFQTPSDKEIIIYGRKTCPYSSKAEEFYRKKGFEVHFRDVSKDTDYMNELIELTGDKRIPVIIQGNRYTVGFGGS